MKGPIQDSAGLAAIRIADLIATAHDLVGASTAARKDFDTAKRLGRWLRLPQPSSGARQPCELLDKPTGAHGKAIGWVPELSVSGNLKLGRRSSDSFFQ
jgi:hypothetical protein